MAGLSKLKSTPSLPESEKIAVCAECGKTRLTFIFTEDVFHFTHGMYKRVCEVCLLEMQLKYAREQAAKIPELEEQLKQAKEKVRLSEEGS